MVRVDSVAQFDVIILVILAAGIVLPMLFRLVGEEIGAQRKTKGVFSALFALALVFAYVGARYILHDRAITLINSRLYKVLHHWPSVHSPIHLLHFTGPVLSLLRQLCCEPKFPSSSANYDPFAAKIIYKPEESSGARSRSRFRYGDSIF